MDILVKNLHFLFLAYAIFLGYTLQAELDGKLTELKESNESLDSIIVREKRSLADVKKFGANLEKSKKRVGEVIVKIEKVQRQLPSTISDAEINDKLLSITNDLKILTPNSLQPRMEENNKFYYSKAFNFDIQGTFLQFLIFFEKLDIMASNGRILNIKYLKMKVSESGDDRSRFKLLDLTTEVEAYRYNQDFDLGEL